MPASKTIKKSDWGDLVSFQDLQDYFFACAQSNERIKVNQGKLIRQVIRQYSEVPENQLHTFLIQLLEQKVVFTDQPLKNLSSQKIINQTKKNVQDEYLKKRALKKTRTPKLKRQRRNDGIKNYFHRLGEYKLLSKEEEIRYAKMKQSDDPEIRQIGRNKLLNHNLKLVISIARRYSSKKVGLLDLIQEGSLGMLKAIEKFDYRLGYKFSTYATWWIRQAITRAISDQSRTVRIPVHMVENINRIKRLERKMMQELGREPTFEEIAARSDIPKINGQLVQSILRMANDPISLEKPIGTSETTQFSNFIKDTKIESPEQKVEDSDVKVKLDLIFEDIFSAREEKVIRMRYGCMPTRLSTVLRLAKETNDPGYQKLDNAIKKHKIHCNTWIPVVQRLYDPIINAQINKYEASHSLEQISHEFKHLSPGQIRQIESKTIRRLRSLNQTKKIQNLKAYLNPN